MPAVSFRYKFAPTQLETRLRQPRFISFNVGVTPNIVAPELCRYRAWTGTEADWLDISGATMFRSHADVKTYESWLTESGFKLRWSKFIPEGDGGHQLILAQKPENKSV